MVPNTLVDTSWQPIKLGGGSSFSSLLSTPVDYGSNTQFANAAAPYGTPSAASLGNPELGLAARSVARKGIDSVYNPELGLAARAASRDSAAFQAANPELRMASNVSDIKNNVPTNSVPGTAGPGGGAEGGGFWEGLGGIFDNKYTIGNIAGLAGTVMEMMAFPEARKAARLQNEALRHNIDTAKAEQARRNQNIASFNRPTSAFEAAKV